MTNRMEPNEQPPDNHHHCATPSPHSQNQNENTRWLLYEIHSLKEQLQWLHDTLLTAEQNNEKVHILSHVPSNTDSCVRAWDREYKKIVIRFAHLISGQFNGHTHFDEFSIYYNPDTSAAVNIAFNGGSATSFTELNSNYRIYYAHAENFVSRNQNQKTKEVKRGGI